MPLGCLAFYNFLCNLHLRNVVAATDKEKFKEIIKTLEKNRWRAPDPDRKRRRSASNPKPSKRPKKVGDNGGRKLEDGLDEIPLDFEDDGQELHDDLEDAVVCRGRWC